MPNRASKLKKVVILLLAATLFVFAVWLKVAPNLSSNLASGVSPSVRIWTTTQESDTHTKILLLKGIVFLFALLPTLLLVLVASARSNRGSRLVTKDLFMVSGHWFRPPPLF